jgi:hypothetical protein
MLKLTTVFLLAVTFLTGTINAQTLPAPPRSKESGPDLRRVLLAETENIKNESAVIDVREMNKERRQATRNNWSKTKTALVVALAVVIVGALYVIVKNTTRCVDREPDSCDLVNDPNCVCVRSER